MTLEIDSRRYRVAWEHPQDLSIPLRFDAAQPRFFGAPKAQQQPVIAGDFIGDTRQGGSCNVEELRLIPHCNGTHTECVGHLARARIAIHAILKNAFFPARLITVMPDSAAITGDRYQPRLSENDRLITKSALEKALGDFSAASFPGLIMRTLPNSPEKMAHDYDATPAAFFSLDAMALLCERDVQHLLVDLPSVDRADDDGLMAAHHLFWNVPPGSNDFDPATPSQKTITEMIYVPETVADGIYLLNLQCPAFVSDAAPSRPVIYALTAVR